MGLFKRETVQPGVEPDAWRPTPGDRYEGPAAFSEGFYYPVLNDEWSFESGPDRSMPLVWVADEHEPKGGYLAHAAPDSPNHFHTYGSNPVEMNLSDDG